MNRNSQAKLTNYIKNNQFTASILIIFTGTFSALTGAIWLHGYELPQNLTWPTTNPTTLISNSPGHTLFMLSIFILIIGSALMIQTEN